MNNVAQQISIRSADTSASSATRPRMNAILTNLVYAAHLGLAPVRAFFYKNYNYHLRHTQKINAIKTGVYSDRCASF